MLSILDVLLRISPCTWDGSIAPLSERSCTVMYANCLSFNGDFGVNTDWNWLLRMFALSTVSEYNLPSFLSGALPFESCFVMRETS